MENIQDRLLEQFEEKIGCRFRDKTLLKLAFTHTTYVFEHHGSHYESNQRLEFIGDSVIDLIIGRKLYELAPKEGEGYLSKVRSMIVCEKSFAAVARELGMGQLLLLGKGEELSYGRDRDSTLADAVEAMVAAVYFDQGIEKAEEVVLRILDKTIDDAVHGRLISDYKSKLIEISQVKNNRHLIEFEVVSESGLSHLKTFVVCVKADGRELARAEGKSKKEAEQKCAEEAIGVYNRIFGT